LLNSESDGVKIIMHENNVRHTAYRELEKSRISILKNGGKITERNITENAAKNTDLKQRKRGKRKVEKMTKIQRMEERIKTDDEMCKRINRVLDDVHARKMDYPEGMGTITAIMQYSGRREDENEGKKSLALSA